MRHIPSSTIATIRLVSINDVYKLDHLPKLQTFLSRISSKQNDNNAPSLPLPPSGVLLCGDFLSPSTLSSLDGGRGMCDTLRAAGVTHCSFGNHEADINLVTLRDRVQELSKSIVVLNSNIRSASASASSHNNDNIKWLEELTKPYSIISSQCGLVRVALVGLLGDGDNMFRDGTFKGIPIHHVPTSFTEYHNKLLGSDNNDNGIADFIIPMTHQSIDSDCILAKTMSNIMCEKKKQSTSIDTGGLGVIFGGHEHELINEITNDGIHILKSGCDAEHASIVDLKFEICSTSYNAQRPKPRLVDIKTDFVDLTTMKDSFVVKKIIDKHMSSIRKMDEEIIIDESIYNSTLINNALMVEQPLSSQGTRYKQTTVGAFFCQAIKEELEVDVAIINGSSIKGNVNKYANNKMSYSQLNNELPFPTKIIIVPMTKRQLLDAIHYSRTNVNENRSSRNNNDNKCKSSTTTIASGEGQNDNIPRKGYLQVDFEFDTEKNNDNSNNDYDKVLQVALPRNLMGGFCDIKILIDMGTKLKKEHRFPSADNFIPALDLVTRHCCKAKWFNIVQNKNFLSFDDFDINSDGVLDRNEIKVMIKKLLGYVPSDFVIDDMIACIDEDENGVIDMKEFSYAIAKIERNNNASTTT